MPKLDCKICGGTGWTVAEQGGISAAARCACVAEVQAAEIETQAQIPANYKHASFETFHLPQDNPTAQRALADVMLAVASYTRNFPSNAKPGILLVVTPGTG